jgi:hypothetical protein
LSEKKKLEELVKQYNFVSRMLREDETSLTYAQALEGSLPWIDKSDDRGNVVHIASCCFPLFSLATY